jgi:starch synthase
MARKKENGEVVSVESKSSVASKGTTKKCQRAKGETIAKKAVSKTTKSKTTTKSKQVAEIVEVKNKKSVLFVASEGLPFIKTGGLADVIGSLPKELAKRGNYEVSVIMPLYSKIDAGLRDNFTFLGNFNVSLAWRNQYCGLFSCRLDGVNFYFIDNEYYFKRDSIYGCYDDGERFAFFSKAVVDSMGYLDFYPDIVNCNDWQSAAVVIYLKTIYGQSYGFDNIKTLFTIHNIEYQGKYGKDTACDLFGFPEWAHGGVEFDGCLNLMKGAIEFSDAVSTVSPTYAKEIKDPFFAHGLESVILRNENKLCGILNGLDLDLYNPETDNSLFKNYGVNDLSGKAECKRELQRMLGLPEREVPVIALISRLVSHKGLDLVKSVLDEILYEDVQFVVLGKGDVDYENFFKYMESKYDGKCRALIAFNKDMASKIYSGCDIFLMPSKQEPCGLSQMIACRYASVPVVRKTGGLADSIVAFNDNRENGNGFVFNHYNAHEMLYVIKDAIYTYGNKPVWEKLVNSAVTSDFSWEKSSCSYEMLYDALTGDKK